MLKSIEIHNFKIFENAKINLKLDEERSINNLKRTNKQKDGYYPFAIAIIGKNASGKSTLLESLYFFNQVCSNLIYQSLYQMLLYKLQHSSNHSGNHIDRNKVIANFQKVFFKNLNKNIVFIIKFADKNQVIEMNLKITKDLLVSERLYVNKVLKWQQNDVFINQFKSKILDLKFQKFNFEYLDHQLDLFSSFDLHNFSNKYKIWNKKNLLSCHQRF